MGPPIVLARWVGPSPGQIAKQETDNRAKQLFQKMEERLAKAKTLECAFEIKDEFSAPGDPRTTLLLEGSLFLAEGNRARQEMSERTEGRPIFHMLVSDGTRWWWHDKGSPPHLVNKKPGNNLNPDFLTALARTGLSLPGLPGGWQHGYCIADPLTPNGVPL
jgi:outer membrane lipoprotein-sorting protein